MQLCKAPYMYDATLCQYAQFLTTRQLNTFSFPREAVYDTVVKLIT
jgi:hypothetical protein